MLYHVTMTHAPGDCPAYNPEIRPKMMEFEDGVDQMAKDLDVKVHFLVNGLPEHVAFALVETDVPAAVARLLASVPLVQDFKVTPVVHQHDVIEMAKKMAAQS